MNVFSLSGLLVEFGVLVHAHVHLKQIPFCSDKIRDAFLSVAEVPFISLP